MPNGVEEVLKDIHVLFAKSEPYGDSTDLIVVSKEKMFELLEKLNEELNDVLERYEGTMLARERARLEMEREKANQIAEARLKADDIHAKSLTYTDNMIANISAIIETAKYDLKNSMIEVMAKMEEQEERLVRAREGVKDELTKMHESDTYLELLEKLRKRAEDKRLSGDDKQEEDIFEEEKPAAPAINIRIDKPGENAGVTISKRRLFGGSKSKPASTGSAAPAEHEEGMPYSAEEFDLDGEYFAWQEEQAEEGTEKKPKKKGWFGKKK
ncbi:MAG: hypothetical protein K6E85_05020 [Lachnospiraceae bacterium]|nr:hypothetical protein [Lachnospiraceae bacterium]